MSDVKKLLKKHQQLNQLDAAKVVSHVQRNKDDWVINTIMLEGYDVPFKYRRKTVYKSLKGARVNLTFYPETETIASRCRVSSNIANILQTLPRPTASALVISVTCFAPIKMTCH